MTSIENDHEIEISKLNSLHLEKIEEAERKIMNQRDEIAKLESQLQDKTDLISSQTDSEKLWERTQVQRLSSEVFSAPHQAPAAGPQSLPSEIVSEAHKEVRRLQELRRYIQEECDQLLLRKEKLKEEVVWHVGKKSMKFPGHLISDSSIYDHEYDISKVNNDVWHGTSRNLDSKVVSMQNHRTSL